MGKLRVAGFVKESIVDGPGIRYVIFTQGCSHKCFGCHNPHTHDYSGGDLVDTQDIYDDIIKNPLLKGVTISGGEPFDQAKELAKLASKLKGKDYDIISYTGYKYEYLYKMTDENNAYIELLKNTDILVDGKFEISLKNDMLNFRGSENQRIIDCRESMSTGSIITIEM